jgi:hypothetical protein
MFERLTRYALVAGITVLFAVMWGLMIRANLPDPTTARLRPDYTRLLPAGQDERRELWDIYFESFRVGESELVVERQEDGNLLLHSRLEVDVGTATKFLTGTGGTFDVDFKARISPLRGLTSFDVVSDLLGLQVFGAVRDGELLLSGHMGSERIRTALPFDENRIMGEILSPMSALPELTEDEIGRVSSVELFNPLTGTMQEVTISVAATRTAQLAEGEAVLYELRSVMGRSRWSSWVTEGGDVLIQGTPFGLRLQKRSLQSGLVAELLAQSARGGQAGGLPGPQIP